MSPTDAEVCSKCGVLLLRSEQACVFGGMIVCAECDRVLRSRQVPQPAPSLAPAVPAETVAAPSKQVVQVVIVAKTKSIGIAFVLTFLFGPLGMFYSTVVGGIVMLIISIPASILTLGFSLLITQPVCIIWGMIAASMHNKKLLAGVDAREIVRPLVPSPKLAFPAETVAAPFSPAPTQPAGSRRTRPVWVVGAIGCGLAGICAVVALIVLMKSHNIGGGLLKENLAPKVVNSQGEKSVLEADETPSHITSGPISGGEAITTVAADANAVVPKPTLNGAKSPARVTNQGPEQVSGLQMVPRFVESPLECSFPCWSPDGKEIMFVGRSLRQQRSGVCPGNIWIASADGSKRRMVTNFFFGNTPVPEGRKANSLKLNVIAASWSPDGQKIVFEAYEGEGSGGHKSDLYVMNVDGTDIYQLAKGVEGGLPRWSPDGKHVIFEHSGSSIAADLDGTSFSSLGLTAKGMFGEMKMFETIPDIREGFGGIAPKLYVEHACIGMNGSVLAIGYEQKKVLPGAPPQKNKDTAGICIINRNWSQIKWVLKAPIQDVFAMSWSPDQKRVVVDCADYHPYIRDLYLVDIASGKQTKLVEGTNPSWSPDGKRIAFEGGDGGGRGDIYLIDSDGKNLQRITNLTSLGVHMIWGSHPCWSPDGKRIVFKRGPYVSTAQPAGVYPRGQYLWTADREGVEQTCIIRTGDYSRVDNTGTRRGPFEYLPCWRPDGMIVFPVYKERTAWGPTLFNPLAGPAKDNEPGFELSVTSHDGANVRRLIILKSPTEGDEVSWSPDGSKMAFDKNENIWVADGDGTDQKRLTGGHNPRWSHDGEKILYVQGSEHNKVLCVINADGSNQTQITEPSHGYSAYHSWCPDGKKIAFEGEYGLWVVSAQGGDAHRLVPGVHQPAWSPDGQSIAFFIQYKPAEITEPTMSPNSICVANADGGGIRPVMQVGETEYGYNTVKNLSWSLDGKYILFEETAKGGYDYLDQHYIWIVDIHEPILYVLAD